MDSKELLKLLDDHELNVFSTSELEGIIGQEYEVWKPALRTLSNNGLIVLLEKGKYARHNFADPLVIGSFLLNKGVIGNWSAMNHHGLTSQISNTVFLQSSKRVADKIILGVNYKIITITKNALIGIEQIGYGNNVYYVTDLEKTILDCMHLPQYAGEYVDVIRAVYSSKLDIDKLIIYCTAIANGAVTKRIGYLLEEFDIEGHDTFATYALATLKSGYILLDPRGYEDGKHNSRWGIKVNITHEDLQSIITNTY